MNAEASQAPETRSVNARLAGFRFLTVLVSLPFAAALIFAAAQALRNGETAKFAILVILTVGVFVAMWGAAAFLGWQARFVRSNKDALDRAASALPPVFVKVRVRDTENGRRVLVQKRLNLGVSRKDVNLIDVDREESPAEALLHVAPALTGFSTVFFGLIVNMYVYIAENLTHRLSTAGYWAIGATVTLAILFIATTITKTIRGRDARAAELANTEQQLTNLAIVPEAAWNDEHFMEIARALEQAVNDHPVATPELQHDFFAATSTLLAYASTPLPTPEAKTVAEATHLHDDPSVKAVSDAYTRMNEAKATARAIASARTETLRLKTDPTGTHSRNEQVLKLAQTLQVSL